MLPNPKAPKVTCAIPALGKISIAEVGMGVRVGGIGVAVGIGVGGTGVAVGGVVSPIPLPPPGVAVGSWTGGVVGSDGGGGGEVGPLP